MFPNEKIHITALRSVVYLHANPNSTVYHYKYGPEIPTYELVYKLSGECYTSYGGNLMHNTPNSIEFLPKKKYVEYTVDHITFGDCIDIYFDTDYPLPQTSINADFSGNKTLRSLFERINRLWVQKQDGYYYKCMALFYEILAALQKPTGVYLPTETYKKIQKGIDYLHAHYCDKSIDYTTPAQLCGISYTYFKRRYLQNFGLPPLQYVTRLRMERACELLSANHYRIHEIADQCGYENAYYFSTAFKKHFGVAPKFYTTPKQ